MPRWWYTARLRLRSLLRRDVVERDLDDELQYHLEQQTQALLAQGLDADEAYRHARRAIGGVQQQKETVRDRWGVRALETLVRDVRYAGRTLRRDARFAVGAIAVLALGIGANAAMVSVVDGVLLRPLPYPDPDRLVVIREFVPQVRQTARSVNPLHFREWREGCRCFDQVALINSFPTSVTGSDTVPERLLSSSVTPSFFPMLGIEAQHGRVFLPDEDSAEDRVVLISDGLWRRRFAADPEIAGQTIVLDGFEWVIVGVLPSGFRHFGPGVSNRRVDVYRPWAVNPEDWWNWNNNYSYTAVGRIADGVSLDEALAELNGIQAGITEHFEGEAAGYDLMAELVLLHEWVTGSSRAGLWLVLGAVGVAFLVACANLANLMLTRSMARKREAGVRSALGASRVAVFRSALVESALLAAVGTVFGVALAALFLQGLAGVAPASLPRLDDVRLDWPVLLVGGGLFVLATVAFGVVPAARLARVDPQAALRANARSVTDGGGRLPQVMVAAEVALSAGLLVVAGLLLTSFVRLSGVDRGFDGANVLTADLLLPARDYGDMGRYSDEGLQRRRQFWSTLTDRLEAEPGVVAAGVASQLPLRGSSYGAAVVPAGETRPRSELPSAQYRFVSSGYFRAMDLPVLQGRAIRRADYPRPVAMMSVRLAEQLWPGASPVGQRFGYRNEGDGEELFEVIGIVPEVHTNDFTAEPIPLVYVPLWVPGSPVTSIAVRTDGDPAAAAGFLRSTVTAMDSALPIANVRTMREIESAAVAERRFQLWLVVAFAMASLLTAALGTYSVLGYTVTRRTREIAIRLALGARPDAVVGMVMRQGLVPVGVGLGAGVVATLAFGGALSDLLFAVAPTDPVTFVAVAGVIVAAAALACWIPARRAARTSALDALRYE